MKFDNRLVPTIPELNRPAINRTDLISAGVCGDDAMSYHAAKQMEEIMRTRETFVLAEEFAA